MKSSTALLASLFSFALMNPALADDLHHPDKAKPATAAKAQKAAPEQTVKKMQGNVKRMQVQLDRLTKARNDAEVQKIMVEHMQTMEENMMMAEGMMGMDCASMHGGQGTQGMGHHPTMGGGMGMMGGQGAGPEAMMQRMQQLEQRMDRLEQNTPPAAPR